MQAIIVGFTDIVSTATVAIAQMQGTPDVAAGADATAIANAFREVGSHDAAMKMFTSS